MIAPEPSIDPAFAIESKSYGTSRSSLVNTGALEPPGNHSFTSRPGNVPPARPKMISRLDIPSSIS